MSDGGKGSSPRPFSVKYDDFSNSWDKIFGKRTPKENDVVFGFFADGSSKQQPIMLGILPKYYKNPNNAGVGFNDVRDDKTVASAPRPPQSRIYNTDGTGVQITENTDPSTLRYPRSYQVKNSSITPLINNLNIPNNSETVSVMWDKKIHVDKNVETAQVSGTTGANYTWSEPDSPYQPKYPYNNVNETESGHVFEMDDTFGHERISMIHRTGTFIEMHPDGSKVEKITKANYQITMSDDNVHIMGTANKTVEQNFNLLVNADGNIQIFGNVNVTCFGSNTNITAPTGNISIAAAQDLTLSGNNISILANKNIRKVASASISVDCPGGLNMLRGSFSSAGNIDSVNGWTGNIVDINGKIIHVVGGHVVNGFK